MTFTDIQTDIAERMSLTSDTALARIGRSINERYRWMSSSMGLDTMVRTVAVGRTIVANRSIVFGPTPIPVEKILSVYNTAYTPARVLTEFSFDELRNMSVGTDPPSQYAIQLMGAKTVTIFLNVTPTTVYTLTADVMSNQATLSGLMVPAFTESFHDILFYGSMATEYDKMEKPTLAAKFEGRYEQRLGEYRLFIAKSAYKDIHQGKTGISQFTPLV